MTVVTSSLVRVPVQAIPDLVMHVLSLSAPAEIAQVIVSRVRPETKGFSIFPDTKDRTRP